MKLEKHTSNKNQTRQEAFEQLNNAFKRLYKSVTTVMITKEFIVYIIFCGFLVEFAILCTHFFK